MLDTVCWVNGCDLRCIFVVILFGAGSVFSSEQLGGAIGWIVGGVMVAAAIAVPLFCGWLATKVVSWALNNDF